MCGVKKDEPGETAHNRSFADVWYFHSLEAQAFFSFGFGLTQSEFSVGLEGTKKELVSTRTFFQNQRF